MGACPETMPILMHNQVNRVGVVAMLIGVVCLIAVLNMDGMHSEADYEATHPTSAFLKGKREFTIYTKKNVHQAQSTAKVAGKAEKAEVSAASAASSAAVDEEASAPGANPLKMHKKAKKVKKAAKKKVAKEPPVVKKKKEEEHLNAIKINTKMFKKKAAAQEKEASKYEKKEIKDLKKLDEKTNGKSADKKIKTSEMTFAQEMASLMQEVEDEDKATHHNGFAHFLKGKREFTKFSKKDVSRAEKTAKAAEAASTAESAAAKAAAAARSHLAVRGGVVQVKTTHKKPKKKTVKAKKPKTVKPLAKKHKKTAAEKKEENYKKIMSKAAKKAIKKALAKATKVAVKNGHNAGDGRNAVKTAAAKLHGLEEN